MKSDKKLKLKLKISNDICKN